MEPKKEYIDKMSGTKNENNATNGKRRDEKMNAMMKKMGPTGKRGQDGYKTGNERIDWLIEKLGVKKEDKGNMTEEKMNVPNEPMNGTKGNKSEEKMNEPNGNMNRAEGNMKEEKMNMSKRKLRKDNEDNLRKGKKRKCASKTDLDDELEYDWMTKGLVVCYALEEVVRATQANRMET